MIGALSGPRPRIIAVFRCKQRKRNAQAATLTFIGNRVLLDVLALRDVPHRHLPGGVCYVMAMHKLPSNLDVSLEVGPARFSTYRRHAANTEKASRLYMWNLSLSARWWGPLSYLEVALRNKLHDALKDSVGQARWWNSRDLGISRQLKRRIEQAENFAELQKNSQPSVDDVVAASSFGLWTSVLHRDNGQVLWRDYLSGKFGSAKRGQLFDRTYKLKKLRDRIAHHEPIFKENQNRHLDELDFVLNAIDPTLPRLVKDCFPGLPAVIQGYDAAITRGEVDL